MTENSSIASQQELYGLSDSWQRLAVLCQVCGTVSIFRLVKKETMGKAYPKCKCGIGIIIPEGTRYETESVFRPDVIQIVVLRTTRSGLEAGLRIKCLTVDEKIQSVEKEQEQVDHPQHYGGDENPYETIKVIEAWGVDFHLGNVLKYVSRAGRKEKEKELEDLKKARWYLDRKIRQLEKK